MKARTVVLLSVVLVLFGALAYAADCNNGGRYEDMGDGTVQDCRTGLIWLKDASCTATSNGIVNGTGLLKWHDAMKWVEGLHTGLCGLSDLSDRGFWRLPTITELMAMVAYAKKAGYAFPPTLTNAAGTAQWADGDIFTNVESDKYWSSTTLAINATYAWNVDMIDGGAGANEKSTFSAFVWPVRAGQLSSNSASFGSVTIE